MANFKNRILEYGVKPADQFLAHPKNARMHPQFQREAMKAALDTVGFVAPVLEAASGYLVDGHERIWQALQNNNADVPFVRLDISEEEEAYVLATFDPLTALANYDAELLDGLLQEVNSDSPAIQKMLSDLAESNGLYMDTPVVGDDPGAQIDRASELAEQYGTAVGQVWQLGRHRLAVGDCCNRQLNGRLIQGQKIGMILADPPYGMNLDADYSQMPQKTVQGNKYNNVIGDNQDFDFTQFSDIECKEQFWWGADYYCQQLPKGGSWFVWDKRIESNDAVIGSGFELCWSKNPHKRRLLRYLWSGFTARDPNEQRLHPTQKPIAMYEELISEYSETDSVIYDPFLGSGTTIIAAERLARICLACEIYPPYAAVAIQRWEVLTGKRAELLTGLSDQGNQ